MPLTSVSESDALLAGESLVCLAGEDWWYHNRHANRHLMETFARNGNRVLFVNSTGLRIPSLLRDRYAWKRIGRKLASLLRFLRRSEPRLFVFTPLALPLTRRLPRLCRLNQRLIAMQIRLACGLIGASKPILWISTPAVAEAAIELRRRWAKLLVYYCADNIPYFNGADTAAVQALDLKLQVHADLTFFSGRRLFSERRRVSAESVLLPHGVDYMHFAPAQQAQSDPPDELRRLGRPLVGFVGAITGLDVGLIEAVARRNPHVGFVFIGRVLMDVSPLRALGNVFFLGARPYESLPRYFACLRCCMICYRRGDLFNEYRSPKKLLEYFATGHPLVSVTLSELDACAELVYQARDAEEFHQQLVRALAESDPALRRGRIEAARRRDWTVVAAEASMQMTRLLAGRREPVYPGQLPQSSA